MVGVFTLHLAGTYMAHAPAWWFVTSPDGSLVFTVLALVLDTTVMPLLFVLGGYTAAASLDRHRWRDFARRRLTRVGLPWVLGVVVLAPPTTWLWPYAWFTPPPDHLAADVANVLPALDHLASAPPRGAGWQRG